MPKCPQCGNKVGKDDKFCFACGAKLEAGERSSGVDKQQNKKDLSLKDEEIGQFLTCYGAMTCHLAKTNKIKKIEDMGRVLEVSVGLGLMLAKRQPELSDAYIQYSKYTRGADPSEDVDMWLEAYESFREHLQEEV